jgi:predicted nucleotidyltransferase
MDSSTVPPAELNPFELMQRVAVFLESHGIRYRVVGSLASMAYGEPRFTNDIDILADLRPEHTALFLAAFPPPDHYLSETSMQTAIRQAGQFNIIHIPSGIKVDMIVLKPDDYSRTEIERGRRLTSPGEFDVWFASPEDVILNKLIYYREGGSEKHLRDIGSMLMIQGDSVDRAYIASWAAKLGIVAEWQSLVARLET